MIKKVAIRVGIILPLLLIVGYLLRRLGLNLGLGLGGKLKGRLQLGIDGLVEALNQGEGSGADTHQAGCPTVEDIVEAEADNAFSFPVSPQWAINNGFAPGTTWACVQGFAADTTLTQDMCSLVVLEVRNRLQLGWNMPQAFPDDMTLLEACYLDQNLYNMMVNVAQPTVNGFKLYQFCNEATGVNIGNFPA